MGVRRGDRGGAPFDPPADRLAGPMRLLPQPGPLLVAADLHLVAEAALPQGPSGVFGERHLALAAAEEDGALIASTFEADAQGFVRVLDEMRRSEGVETNHRLLDRLMALAAELEAGTAASLYRFGATRAYDELVRLRGAGEDDALVARIEGAIKKTCLEIGVELTDARAGVMTLSCNASIVAPPGPAESRLR